MPSWPSRLLLGTSASGSASSAQRSPENESHPRKHGSSKTTLRREAPTSTSTNASFSSNRNRPVVHGRSLSHPFTSRLNEDRRTKKRIQERNECSGLEILGDETPNVLPACTRDLLFAGHTESLSTREKELAIGKCATCGSHVRWPKDVDVFRCTVCLMVNDLTSAPRLRSSAERASCKEDIDIGSQTLRKVAPVSLERTKALLENCIHRYLQARLDICRKSNKDDGPIPFQDAGQSIRCSNESNLHNIRTLASISTGLPAISASMEQPEHHEIHKFSPDAQLASGSTASRPTSFARTARSDSHIQKAGYAAYSVPSRSQDSQSLLGEWPDSLPNTLPPTVRQSQSEQPKCLFRPLENYLLACFKTCDCLNASFLTPKQPPTARAASEDAVATTLSPKSDKRHYPKDFLPGLDAKTLLLGDFAENGMWWTGGSPIERHPAYRYGPNAHEELSGELVSLKTPRINWAELSEWYHVILSSGQTWQRKWQELQASSHSSRYLDDTTLNNELQEIEDDMAKASIHLQRTLLKATDSLLRRPGRPLKSPRDSRFLLILLANPTFYLPSPGMSTSPGRLLRTVSQSQATTLYVPASSFRPSTNAAHRPINDHAGSVDKHSGIIKRILGLMSNTSLDCNHHFVVWFSRLSEAHLGALVDLVGSFVTYRLSRQHGKSCTPGHTSDSNLIPNIAGPGAGTSAQLHAALDVAGTSKGSGKRKDTIVYGEDWQVKAAARVMSLLFSANNSGVAPRYENSTELGPVARQRVYNHRQILPTNYFYNTLLDYSDLVADFESWESRKGTFSFCQYPMFLSIWAKIHIMEYDARRQMEIKAREAFFTSIMNRKAVSQYLVLNVRRECLVEDSLRGVSEAVGTGQEEIKKGLRIEFSGEEGVDAGGLRKEWFLLLVREVFDPEHGLFTYDEESHYCYFNSNSFETSDQFFLVGAVLGLAIYNSTILDVAFPPFAFRKLLASAPNYSGPTTASSRPAAAHTLEDLAELRPSLAKGLTQLLDYDGDVEKTYCWDFVAHADRYGQAAIVPLCPNGENRPVTNANRREFVDLYIKYLLDTAVTRQYEPFKRGFFTVCGGNALSLFRPEEIELLVRGSDEPLDVATLRAVAVYDGWGKGIQAQREPVVSWFWNSFENSDVKGQRKLLRFITSSDRIPAMGATNLIIKITCMGDNCDRFPIARTCFNMIGVYRYKSREVFETKLWRAVTESEGFGIR